MATIDEIKDYAKYTSLTFIDFLEALGRVADMKNLPLESDLEAAGAGGMGRCGEGVGRVADMKNLPLESNLEAAGAGRCGKMWGGCGEKQTCMHMKNLPLVGFRWLGGGKVWMVGRV